MVVNEKISPVFVFGNYGSEDRLELFPSSTEESVREAERGEFAKTGRCNFFQVRKFTLEVPDFLGALHRVCQEKLSEGASCLSFHLTRLPF